MERGLTQRLSYSKKGKVQEGFRGASKVLTEGNSDRIKWKTNIIFLLKFILFILKVVFLFNLKPTTTNSLHSPIVHMR